NLAASAPVEPPNTVAPASRQSSAAYSKNSFLLRQSSAVRFQSWPQQPLPFLTLSVPPATLRQSHAGLQRAIPQQRSSIQILVPLQIVQISPGLPPLPVAPTSKPVRRLSDSPALTVSRQFPPAAPAM